VENKVLGRRVALGYYYLRQPIERSRQAASVVGLPVESQTALVELPGLGIGCLKQRNSS
jgi:hypothetical protein